MTFQHNLNSNEISIYIHWPFCISKCPYCDFNSHIITKINQEDWCNSYKKEIEYFKHILLNKKITSIYFGGGTPSLMPIKIIEFILNELLKITNIDKKTEITLEANPTSSEQKKFQDIKNLGINRVSIGVQSFNNKSLKFLGRNHTYEEAIKVINMARNIFPNMSFDLIYALPDQTPEKWEKEMKEAISYAVNHISLYQLTIEKGTVFYKKYQNKEFDIPNDVISSEMYDITNEYLKKNNLLQYEISNYASNNKESIHNLCYWNYKNYIGIGPGAHSRLSFTNKITSSIMTYNNPTKWINSIKNNQTSIQYQTTLSKKDTISEIIMMGLRLVSGINESHLIKYFDLKFEDILNTEYLNFLLKSNYIKYNNNNLNLTSAGLKLHNHIIPRILAE